MRLHASRSDGQFGLLRLSSEPGGHESGLETWGGLVVLGNVVVKILVLQVFRVNLDLAILAHPLHITIPHNVGVVQAAQEIDFCLDPFFEFCLRPVPIPVEGDAFASQCLVNSTNTQYLERSDITDLPIRLSFDGTNGPEATPLDETALNFLVLFSLHSGRWRPRRARRSRCLQEQEVKRTGAKVVLQPDEATCAVAQRNRDHSATSAKTLFLQTQIDHRLG
jgi:hypothetical protein